MNAPDASDDPLVNSDEEPSGFGELDQPEFQDTEGDAFEQDGVQGPLNGHDRIPLKVYPECSKPFQHINELDNLLTESKAIAAESDFSDLDDLLKESTASVREAAAAKAARERIKRGGQSAVERAEDQERIRAWEAAHEWQAVANVALFTAYSCQCGSVREVFSGLMRRELHRHLRQSQRWTSVPSALAALPNEVAVQEVSTPVCYRCAADKGWDMAKATFWADRHSNPTGRRSTDA